MNPGTTTPTLATPSRRTAALWGLTVSVALAGGPLVLRGRLPDPIAVHWGLGLGPDRSMPLAASATTDVALWTAVWVTLLVMVPAVSGRRRARAGWWGALAGSSALFLGMGATTLLANLDAPSWTEARLPGWQAAAVLAAAVAAALLAARLRRGATDGSGGEAPVPPELRLRPGQRAVWVGRAGNRWLSGMTVAAGAGLCLLLLMWGLGLVRDETAADASPGLAIVLVAGLFTSSLTARVTEDGLAIGFGPFGWPVRRIPLERVQHAWTETRSPVEVGGWGFRGLPGDATIMLRGGECLVIGYRSGGRLAISVDDAERAASLINALLATRVSA
ncbi:DUF1648 domain-containing protein [Nonomuraea sp. SMC257]|uniref:DUF1648 domain-containing protein n=1 Tax=Nonomuraea montanisoli TaxID=2741721 RepID=A0A7Y6M2Q8_9ACTN|nr:DUF1648 domain-containing protein [Nonomuraea montanisoli]NUW31429.1 DUF1648 domain-containing protein [Nonomuraea montanisoli]